MKKFICTTLSIALMLLGFAFFVETPLTVNAMESNETVLEDVDWSDLGFSNVTITFRENSNENTRALMTEPSVEIDFIIDETNEQVHFERIGNTGYHYIDGVLCRESEYGMVTRQSVTIPSAYRTLSQKHDTGWSNYSMVGYQTWVVRQLTGVAQSAITSMFVTAITGGLTVINVVQNAISDVASLVYGLYELSNKPDEMYAVNFEYRSQYVECNILHYYGLRVAQYNQSFTSIQGCTTLRESLSHYWYSNPHDQTQPTACRLILGSYSY